MADNDIKTEEDIYSEDESSSQFSSMLNAAAKKLSEENAASASAATPVQANETSDSSSDSPANTVKSSSGVLSQEEIERLLAEDNEPQSAGEAQPAPEKKGEPEPQENRAEYEANHAQELEDAAYSPLEEADDTEKIASMLTAGFDDSEEEPKKEAPAPKKKEKKPPNKAIIHVIATVAAVIVALALGFCVSMLMFSDFIKSGGESFAIKAANAVNSQLAVNSELYIYKAYYKAGTASDECLLYGVVSYGGETKTDMYRVVINHDKPNIINVYYTLDEDNESYIAMKNSEDEKVRIQASVLKNYSDTIMQADKEIQINSPAWEKIDCTKVNRGINSQQIKTA
ncbi:MAG: hypothetical protein ACI4KR_12500 [Ruminiclostridium sp.]